MASLEIKTADELISLDVEGRGRTRRAGRETSASKRILRIFLDRGGPIPVDEIVAAFQDGPGEAIHQALVVLDNDDLICIRAGQVDIAYPFSASPTPFVLRLPGGKERYACCNGRARHRADGGSTGGDSVALSPLQDATGVVRFTGRAGTGSGGRHAVARETN